MKLKLVARNCKTPEDQAKEEKRLDSMGAFWFNGKKYPIVGRMIDVPPAVEGQILRHFAGTFVVVPDKQVAAGDFKAGLVQLEPEEKEAALEAARDKKGDKLNKAEEKDVLAAALEVKKQTLASGKE